MRFFSLIFCLLCFNVIVKAQSIENVDFSLQDDFIKVTYDLVNCPDNYRYDLTLTFVKSSGEVVKTNRIKGDIKNVIPGVNKQVQWFYKNEVDDFEGDIKAVLKIVNGYAFVEKPVEMPMQPAPPVVTPKTEEMVNNRIPVSNNYNNNNNNISNDIVIPTSVPNRGPSNAIISMILPGFGGFAVNKTDKLSPILIAAMFWGSAYYSYDSYKQATDNYNLYLSDKTQADMDTHYNLAADFKQKHETFLAAAAGIWLFDVIHVIVKGNKNVRESQGLTKNLRLMPNLKMSNASNPFQLSIVKTF